ncbi:MAG TPA: glycosyltransferase [Candidatus Desulfobacillus sp.]|nr:glycosyltransferase [Candidatus Desulfobacillus sp.]
MSTEKPTKTDRPEGADARPDSEPLPIGAKLLVIVYLVVAVLYLGWRPSTFNPQAMTFSIVVYAAELFGFLISLIHLFMTERLTLRVPPPVPPGLQVDVFVPTINEPVEMVRRTLMAAARMDYPHVTWLLDDGNRREMRLLADELGCRYLTRTKNTHAKAGNLNNALKHSSGELVAFFDADHAPRRDFLLRTLGYFSDEKTAFVQTPQDFFNLDSFEHRREKKGEWQVWMEQTFFWRVIQRGKDYWNAAFFCGSCAVMRRSALEEIGGIATKSVTEDLLTSLRLHKKGWRSVYHAEPLAYGIAPANPQEYVKQRRRWGQGAMQVWRSEGVIFTRGLTLSQRICYLSTLLTYFDGWQKLVFYTAPAVVLLSGTMPVAELGWPFLLRFIPYYVLVFLVFEEMARGYGRSLLIEQYNLARFFAFLQSMAGFFRRRVRFAVTDKTASAGSEGRSRMLPQLLVLALNLVAIPAGVLLQMRMNWLPEGALLANIVWALANGGLALILLRFQRGRSHFQRREYRFPVPLPARLSVAGAPAIFGIIDDISSEGFSFYGQFGQALEPGAAVRVGIFSPASVLDVDATVRSLRFGGEGEERYVKALGASFQWRSREERDRLDVFLYGSDVQWKINRIDERRPTLLQRLRRGLGGKGEDRPEAVPHWAPAIAHAGEVSTMAIVSIGADENQMIALRPLPSGASLNLSVYTRRGISRLKGVADLQETIATPTQSMHHYKLSNL